MIRHLKVARDTAVKSLSVAMVMLKTLIINAPAELRDSIDQPLSDCSAFACRSMDQREGRVDPAHAACRPEPITSTTASAKATMRSLARCRLTLNDETVKHDKALKALVEAKAPSLMASHGIATLTIAEMLILVGGNLGRIRSGAALAKLCGMCPIPASRGKNHRFRLNRGANR